MKHIVARRKATGQFIESAEEQAEEEAKAVEEKENVNTEI